MRRTFIVAAGLSAVVLGSPAVRADAAAAKGYVREAQQLLENRDAISLEQAAAKLDLAEAELDGVDGGAKGAIVGSITEAREKIARAAGAGDKAKYTRKLERVMQEGEGAIGNLVIWKGAENAANELFNDPAAKAALGADLDAAVKKFATFRKLNAKKAGPQILAEVEGGIKQAEDEWAEAKTKDEGSGRDYAYRRVEDRLKQGREALNRLDKDGEDRKALAARLDKVAEQYTQVALADRAKEQVATLQRKIELYQNDWDGYEKETVGPVSWAAFNEKQGNAMSYFLAPKTAVFIQRQGSLLESLADDKEYQAVQSDKTVKAMVADLRAKHDAAYAKMLKFVTVVVDSAAKAPASEAGKFGPLVEDVRLALGEKSPDTLALQALLRKKMTAQAAAATGADEAKVKMIETLRAKAEEVWPKLYEGMGYVGAFDLSHPEKFKGKNIGFLSPNLMGWRYQPGDFYFATTIDGVPVAGKVDPQLLKQIQATEKAIGRAIGDDDADGKWDCIAVVTDRKAKLMAIRKAESTGTVNGVDVKVTRNYDEAVDAVVVEIIAAKCGPFAGAKGRGVLKEDGTIAK